MSALSVPIYTPTTPTPPKPESEAPTCVHYWLIETPRGATTRGICRYCGAVKEYQSAWTGSVWDNDETREPVVRRPEPTLDE